MAVHGGKLGGKLSIDIPENIEISLI